MSYSIEQLTGRVSEGGGLVQSSLYRVIFPSLDLPGTPPRGLDLMCNVTAIPGRQIMTTEYQLGTVTRKIANGYAVTDLNLTFICANDYLARTYFEYWQNLAHNPRTKEVGYYQDYTFPVKIQQLQKGYEFPVFNKQIGFMKKVPSFIKNRLPKLGPIDLSQGEIDLDFGTEDKVAYECTLNECFVTSLSEIALGNANEGITEFTVQLSYKDWTNHVADVDDQGLTPSLIGAGLSIARRAFSFLK
jgi:hypothetical protein